MHFVGYSLKKGVGVMQNQNMLQFQAPTRRDAVVEQLREEIITGKLQPGEVLKDADLASRLGLSITPVREALTQLAAEGLIDMPPNRPKRVAPLTRRKTREQLAVFQVLSLAGYEWGLARLSQQDLQDLHAANAALTEAISQGDVPAAHLASLTFHDVIIRAGGNRELRRILAANMPWVKRLTLLCFPRGTLKLGFERNFEILAAIERGELQSAMELLHQAQDQFRQAVEALPEDSWSD
jgi:DNA-binding GntR family transcriptional regulator